MAAGKEVVQSFFRVQFTLNKIRLHDVAGDLHEDYQVLNQVMSGYKKTPRIRAKLAHYMGFASWEALEEAAEKMAKYNMRAVTTAAPFRKHMEVTI
ncbi:MAG: hypothetical protein AAF975_08800 [Spirochaetota bacterium]